MTPTSPALQNGCSEVVHSCAAINTVFATWSEPAVKVSQTADRIILDFAVWKIPNSDAPEEVLGSRNLCTFWFQTDDLHCIELVFPAGWLRKAAPPPRCKLFSFLWSSPDVIGLFS